MMIRRKRYYPQSEIETGFYANPGEFVLQDGTEYVGPYCIASKQKYTGVSLDKNSQPLFDGVIQHTTNRNITYYNITEKAFDKYIAPEYFYPTLITTDYQLGIFTRFAAQRINDISIIIEISKDQYTSANTTNKPGINKHLYRVIDIPWMIQGREAAMYNDKTLQLKENVMPGIRAYFSDFSEFVK